MKTTAFAMCTVAACLCISLTSASAQTAPQADRQGPERILQLLSEKERAYIVDPSNVSDLTAEDIEHTKRVQRLHELEAAKDVETEPAGAELVSNEAPRQAQPVTEVEIEDLEMQQQESSSIMMRDMARLRAEVLRLNARVEALELEAGNGPVDEQVEGERQFYIPVR